MHSTDYLPEGARKGMTTAPPGVDPESTLIGYTYGYDEESDTVVFGATERAAAAELSRQANEETSQALWTIPPEPSGWEATYTVQPRRRRWVRLVLTVLALVIVLVAIGGYFTHPGWLA